MEKLTEKQRRMLPVAIAAAVLRIRPHGVSAHETAKVLSFGLRKQLYNKAWERFRANANATANAHVVAPLKGEVEQSHNPEQEFMLELAENIDATIKALQKASAEALPLSCIAGEIESFAEYISILLDMLDGLQHELEILSLAALSQCICELVDHAAKHSATWSSLLLDLVRTSAEHSLVKPLCLMALVAAISRSTCSSMMPLLLMTKHLLTSQCSRGPRSANQSDIELRQSLSHNIVQTIVSLLENDDGSTSTSICVESLRELNAMLLYRTNTDLVIHPFVQQEIATILQVCT